RRGVDDVAVDLNAAEPKPNKIPQTLVMVAGDVYEARSLAHPTQQFLQNIVVRLCPMRSAPHLPEVDYVTHQVNGVGLVCLEGLREPGGLGRAGPQVHVRNEQCPNARAELVANCLICQRGGHGVDRSGFASQSCDGASLEGGARRTAGNAFGGFAPRARHRTIAAMQTGLDRPQPWDAPGLCGPPRGRPEPDVWRGCANWGALRGGGLAWPRRAPAHR